MLPDNFENSLQSVRLKKYWAGTRSLELRSMYYKCVRQLHILQRDVEIMGERRIIPVKHTNLEKYRLWFSSGTEQVLVRSSIQLTNSQIGDGIHGDAFALPPSNVIDYSEQLCVLYEEFYLLQNVSLQTGNE
jgi:hypothetical protein